MFVVGVVLGVITSGTLAAMLVMVVRALDSVSGHAPVPHQREMPQI